MPGTVKGLELVRSPGIGRCVAWTYKSFARQTELRVYEQQPTVITRTRHENIS